jgi:hypothetical protein
MMLASRLLLTALLLAVGERPSATDLDIVHAALGKAKPFSEASKVTGKVSLDLEGYDRHWEMQVGQGSTVIVLSRMRGKQGEILMFSPIGTLVGRLPVGAEITNILLCDLADSGFPDLVLDQLDGWGTNVVERSFRVTRVAPSLQEIWKASSLSVDSSPGRSESSRSFVRCEPPGLGFPGTRLLYLTEVRQKGKVRLSRRSLQLVRDKLVEAPWP